MHAASSPQTFDLYVRRADAGMVWSYRDRGVTLSTERIGWALGNERHETPLTDTVAVHLQTNAVGQFSIAICRITFTDGFALNVLSANSSGMHDDGQAVLYRDFVRALHGRLAALKGATIEYTVGYSVTRRNVGFVLLAVVVAFFLGLPTVLLFLSPQLSLVSALYFGVLLAWPLYRTVVTNEPRTYDPHNIPAEMLET